MSSDLCRIARRLTASQEADDISGGLDDDQCQPWSPKTALPPAFRTYTASLYKRLAVTSQTHSDSTPYPQAEFQDPDGKAASWHFGSTYHCWPFPSSSPALSVEEQPTRPTEHADRGRDACEHKCPLSKDTDYGSPREQSEAPSI